MVREMGRRRESELAAALAALETQARAAGAEREELLDVTLQAADALARAESTGDLAARAEEGLTTVLGCERTAMLRFADSVLARLDDPEDRPRLHEGEVAAAASALRAGVPRLLSQQATSIGTDGLPHAGGSTVTALALPVRLGEANDAVAICTWQGETEQPPSDRVRLAMLLCSVAGVVASRLE